ncbi:transport and Golgi organization protein 6 homolog [Fopius arisanus]|uniref:Transport and Golgi organization protein 6 homolog n=1 Tax=Fopius arisanus TaxID=64838 RepID=A0A9R1TRN9_9HYME|nr:PREDICTED: transport and Golgi organization protein 6 homolog [Fopius arisanus]XP_011314138.1 PREDICTED: transport and Golgi organization protein 6 homolog [Fopius arisanus]
MDNSERPVTMDYHGILLKLTTAECMNQTFTLLPEESQKKIEDCCNEAKDESVSCKYLKTILHVLEGLYKDVLSKSETFMSVNEYRCVKTAIEHVISTGIFPCLIPDISRELKTLYPPALNIQEKLNDFIKYERLSTTVRAVLGMFSEISLRPAILTQLGPILGGLVQLAHAPLMKPKPLESQSSGFQMSPELYEKLVQEQAEFKGILVETINNCPQSAVIKELMVLLGLQRIPQWVKKNVRLYLIQLIMQPTGVYALITVTCQDAVDVGIHWDRLGTISKLIAMNHGNNPEEYYSTVCSQLLELLSCTTVRNSPEIARTCIKAIHEVHPEVCREKIINKICEPLLITRGSSDIRLAPRTETEVSECLENLRKLFVSTDAKFKSLPVDLISATAVPLFCMYKRTWESPCILRLKSKELLLNLLNSGCLRDKLFSAFLGHDNSGYFGVKLKFQFGPSGGLETTGEVDDINPEDSADCLLDLVKNFHDLPWHLFNYAQDFFCQSKKRGTNVLDQLESQLVVMKLLLTLANCKTVQERQLRHPEHLIKFITELFEESVVSGDEEDHVDILYVSLMLIKEMVTERKKPKEWSWTPFEDLSRFLREKLITWECPQNLKSLVEEVQRIIKQRGVSPRFEDLSVDDKKETAFDEALKDLADPLLPVRAHGLITLTKLIETSSSTVTGKSDLLVYLFQQNLKDEDSFIYLAAINGLCALALKFPQKVIEILIHEFTDMTRDTDSAAVAPENRAKLGEILVKTTRLLGEMAPAYKNVLINGFLTAIRDSDPMVRASSLSCLGELCTVLGFALGNAVIEVLYCIGCIIETDKFPECRRAAVLVVTLLIRGLGKDVLINVGSQLLPVYRALKHLRDNDSDSVLRLHAQLALEELNDIVKGVLFEEPRLERNILLLR